MELLLHLLLALKYDYSVCWFQWLDQEMLCCSEQFGYSLQRHSSIASVDTDVRKWKLPTLWEHFCISLCALSPPAISLEWSGSWSPPGCSRWRSGGRPSFCAAFSGPVQREGLLTLLSFMRFCGQGFMCIWEKERDEFSSVLKLIPVSAV